MLNLTLIFILCLLFLSFLSQFSRHSWLRSHIDFGLILLGTSFVLYKSIIFFTLSNDSPIVFLEKFYLFMGIGILFLCLKKRDPLWDRHVLWIDFFFLFHFAILWGFCFSGYLNDQNASLIREWVWNEDLDLHSHHSHHRTFEYFIQRETLFSTNIFFLTQKILGEEHWEILVDLVRRGYHDVAPYILQSFFLLSLSILLLFCYTFIGMLANLCLLWGVRSLGYPLALLTLGLAGISLYLETGLWEWDDDEPHLIFLQMRLFYHFIYFLALHEYAKGKQGTSLSSDAVFLVVGLFQSFLFIAFHLFSAEQDRIESQKFLFFFLVVSFFYVLLAFLFWGIGQKKNTYSILTRKFTNIARKLIEFIENFIFRLKISYLNLRNKKIHLKFFLIYFIFLQIIIFFLHRKLSSSEFSLSDFLNIYNKSLKELLNKNSFFYDFRFWGIAFFCLLFFVAFWLLLDRRDLESQWEEPP
jgi:hypothetical protein